MKPVLPLLILFSVRAYAQTGEELFFTGQYEQAAAEIERVPDAARTASTLNILGMAYHRLGRLMEAETAYERAIKADPNLAAPRNNLGAVFYSQRKFSEADREFRRAADRDVDSVVLT